MSEVVTVRVSSSDLECRRATALVVWIGADHLEGVSLGLGLDSAAEGRLVRRDGRGLMLDHVVLDLSVLLSLELVQLPTCVAVQDLQVVQAVDRGGTCCGGCLVVLLRVKHIKPLLVPSALRRSELILKLAAECCCLSWWTCLGLESGSLTAFLITATDRFDRQLFAQVLMALMERAFVACIRRNLSVTVIVTHGCQFRQNRWLTLLYPTLDAFHQFALPGEDCLGRVSLGSPLAPQFELHCVLLVLLQLRLHLLHVRFGVDDGLE